MKVHAKSNEDVFEKMSVGEAVRTMAVPAVAAQLIVLIYNLADTFAARFCQGFWRLTGKTRRRVSRPIA